MEQFSVRDETGGDMSAGFRMTTIAFMVASTFAAAPAGAASVGGDIGAAPIDVNELPPAEPSGLVADLGDAPSTDLCDSNVVIRLCRGSVASVSGTGADAALSVAEFGISTFSNNITIHGGGGSGALHTVSDSAGILPGSGCQSISRTTVACDDAPFLIVDAGGGSDQVSVDGSGDKGVVDVHVGAGDDSVSVDVGGIVARVWGDEGDDALSVERGPNPQISGGNGDDVITTGTALIDGWFNIFPDSGADTVIGGPSSDTIWNESSSAGEEYGPDSYSGGGGPDYVGYDLSDRPVEVTIDGRPNDGVVGEGDNVLSDVEVVSGSLKDDYLSAGPHGSTLYGDDGADELVGGGGLDFLFGNDGDDDLEGGPAADVFNCGKGVDVAHFDPSDTFSSRDDGRRDGTNGGCEKRTSVVNAPDLGDTPDVWNAPDLGVLGVQIQSG